MQVQYPILLCDIIYQREIQICQAVYSIAKKETDDLCLTPLWRLAMGRCEGSLVIPSLYGKVYLLLNLLSDHSVSNHPNRRSPGPTFATLPNLASLLPRSVLR